MSNGAALPRRVATGLRSTRVGGPVGLGAVALLLAGVLALGLTPRWQDEQAQAEQQHALLVRSATAHRPAAAPPIERLAGPWQALPSADQALQRAADLSQLAQRLGVTVDGSRLGRPVALATAGGPPLQRLPLSLVAHGPYPALRQWVAEALQRDDALLLERVRLSRPNAEATELAAELQWGLLQRQAGDGGARP